MVRVVRNDMPEPRPGEVLPDTVSVPVKEPLPPGIVPGSSIRYVGPIEPFESETAPKTLRPAKAGQGRKGLYRRHEGRFLSPDFTDQERSQAEAG
jgi:hypothetical protein